MMQLSEKYRPTNWNEFLGNEKAVKRVRMLLDRPGFGADSGDAFWICGPTGTGKTTMAQIIARDLGAYDEWSYMERDGKGTTARDVQQLERWMWMCPPSGEWKVLVINEAQDMADGAAQAFLTLLDSGRLPAKRLVVFTSTAELQGNLFGHEDQVCRPLRGRVKVISFTNQGLCQAFATRAREIAQAEGLDGKSASAYTRLVQDSRNSMREVLQRIDGLEMMA